MQRKHPHPNQYHHSTLVPIFLGLVLALSGAVATAAGISPEEVVKLVNRSRIENNLSVLTNNTELAAAAKAKAEDMIKNDYFAHTSPKGVEPWAWMKQAGYDYKYAGENLAINFTDAKEEHSAWMKSKTHRDNILNRNYTEVGVAVVTGKIDGETAIVTVQMFGTPRVAVVTAPRAAEPAPVTLPIPAVRGTETELPTISVVSGESPQVTVPETNVLMPTPTPVAYAAPRPSTAEHLQLFMIMLLALSLAASPVAILWRVYTAVFEMMRSRFQEFFLPSSPTVAKV